MDTCTAKHLYRTRQPIYIYILYTYLQWKHFTFLKIQKIPEILRNFDRNFEINYFIKLELIMSNLIVKINKKINKKSNKYNKKSKSETVSMYEIFLFQKFAKLSQY